MSKTTMAYGFFKSTGIALREVANRNFAVSKKGNKIFIENQSRRNNSLSRTIVKGLGGKPKYGRL